MTPENTRPYAVGSGVASPPPGHGDACGCVAVTFHRSMPGYGMTPLVGLPDLARRCGVAEVYIKDESRRLDLPAFKALGASWATNRALSARLGVYPQHSLDDLRELVTGVPLTLVTATDGNHGQALARMASLLGLSARIYVPGGLDASVITAIRSEGATVVDTAAEYDAAVALSAASISGDDVLIQDTAWPGYEQVPGWIVEGYDTLFAEIDEQLDAAPTLVVVPTGVGSLLQAALAHDAGVAHDTARTRVLAVEPVTAACVTASLAAGEPRTVDTSAPTPMAGLNCGTVSSLAWPLISDRLAGSVGVSNDESLAAVRELARYRIAAGPCGTASYAGVIAARGIRGLAEAVGLAAGARVVLLNTEGATRREGVTRRTASYPMEGDRT